MFSAACKIARAFTRPVVVSMHRYDDSCSAGIGAFVVVNRDGWFLTADHIIQSLFDCDTTCKAIAQYETAIAELEANKQISPKERRNRVNAMKKPPGNAPRHYSPWWGDGVTIGELHRLPEVGANPRERV
jgi:hypothetical protein